ncbi:HNH endonuclease [Companilactobacillus metriopterae]|uniref:HNH endonuclease n=1 Tax=Companilactobacillus metriopterae TaxID=1909267 RepID=UPI00100A51BD|nr:HNH endonuclease [Companilactobacillus metriopterae]
MAKPWAKSFYHSKQWYKARSQYIKEVDGLCERCLAKGEYVPGVIVHHKIHLTILNINDPDITLNKDNFEYLCQTCHNEEHHGQASVIRNDLMFDDKGNVIKKEN